MRRSQKHLIAAALAALGGSTLGGSTLAAQSRTLDEYVALGLRQNLGLKQEELAVQRSGAALREARGLFLPTATINASSGSVGSSIQIAAWG